MQWRDITESFKEACSKLPEETLVSNPHFNLFDCISAIPVSDKKMDTGLEIPTAKERGKWTLQDITDSSFSLDIQQLVNILDLLLLSNMDWMCGQLLIHTFFSSVFYVNYENSPSPLIKAFLSGLSRSMSLTRIFILGAGVYYDEDFFSDTRGFLIDPNDNAQDPEQVFRKTATICDHLEQSLKTPAKLKNALESLDPSLALSIYTPEELVGHTKSLLARFTFIRHYYSLWSNLTDHSAVLSKSVQTALTASLQEIIHSSEKSLSPTNHPAFDVTIHRKLYSQTPATPKFLSVLDGFTLYSSFVRHVYTISTLFVQAKESLDFIESSKSSKDILSVLQFELETLWVEEKEMLIPTRSYLNNCIFFLIKQDNPIQIFPSIKSHSPASNAKPQPSTPTPSKLFIDILQECQTLFSLSLKSSCLNRSRQRRQLYHLALSFAQLSGHLVTLEPQLHPDALFLCSPPRSFEFIFLKWSNLQFLGLAAKYFALGFELDMYAPYEMAQAYLILEFIYAEIVGLASDSCLESSAVDELEKLDLTGGSGFALQEFIAFYNLQAQLSKASFKICKYVAKSNLSFALPPKSLFQPSIHFENRFNKLLSHYPSSFSTMMGAGHSWNLQQHIQSQIPIFDALGKDELLKECISSISKCIQDLESFISNSTTLSFKKMSAKCLEGCVDNLKFLKHNPLDLQLDLGFVNHPQYCSIATHQ